MAERVRVGVIGHGYFGTFHARQYEGHPAVDLIGVADPRPDAAEAIQVTYGNRYLSDYRGLIGKVDAVSVAVPTAMHFEVARELIAAGIHVLVEKPLADTAGAARQLAAEAEAAGVVLNVGHIERFSATYQALKNALEGPPRLIECRRHAPWRGRIIDVDVVLDMMIHDIDLVLDLVGAEPIEVEASGLDMKGHGLDSVLARVVFSGGVCAHISASRVAPRIARTMNITEDKRTLWADLATGKIGIYSNEDSSAEETEIAHRDSLRAEIDAFLDAIAGKRSTGTRGPEAVAALELAETIRAMAHR